MFRLWQPHLDLIDLRFLKTIKKDGRPQNPLVTTKSIHQSLQCYSLNDQVMEEALIEVLTMSHFAVF